MSFTPQLREELHKSVKPKNMSHPSFIRAFCEKHNISNLRSVRKAWDMSGQNKKHKHTLTKLATTNKND